MAIWIHMRPSKPSFKDGSILQHTRSSSLSSGLALIFQRKEAVKRAYFDKLCCKKYEGRNDIDKIAYKSIQAIHSFVI